MLRNLTLAAMSKPDLLSLLPDLHERHFARGEMVIDQGADVDTVSFLATATVANIVTLIDGRGVEAFEMGPEGVTGLAAFLAEAPCAWSVEARTAGMVYEIAARKLRRAAETSVSLRRQLIVLTHDYQAQASLAVACAAYHNVTARLASLLLFRAARTGEDDLACTHDDLATSLGVQRTTVTEAALSLKGAGAIRYSRGHVRIIRHDALASLACDCHSTRLPLHQAGGVDAASRADAPNVR